MPTIIMEIRHDTTSVHARCIRLEYFVCHNLQNIYLEGLFIVYEERIGVQMPVQVKSPPVVQNISLSRKANCNSVE